MNYTVIQKVISIHLKNDNAEFEASSSSSDWDMLEDYYHSHRFDDENNPHKLEDSELSITPEELLTGCSTNDTIINIQESKEIDSQPIINVENSNSSTIENINTSQYIKIRQSLDYLSAVTYEPANFDLYFIQYPKRLVNRGCAYFLPTSLEFSQPLTLFYGCLTGIILVGGFILFSL